MTVQELINLDWNKVNKMDAKELKRIVQFGAMQANRYISAAKKGDYNSPGLYYVLNNDRKFSSKNKNQGQLKSELRDLIMFLDNKTITRKGAKEFYDKTTVRFINEKHKNINPGNMSDFWEAYNKFLESETGKAKYGSLKSQLQDVVFDTLYDNGFDIETTLLELEDENFEWLEVEKGESPL